MYKLSKKELPGFKERINYAKALIKIMNIKKCKNLHIPKYKELGIYKLSTSSLNNTKYINVKNKHGVKYNKIKYEKYDD